MPEIFKKITDNECDMTMFFNNFFITLNLYRQPLEFTAKLIDMFLLGGEDSIFELIYEMLNICQHEIKTIDN